jgi:predicted DNA-binding protein
MPQVSARLPEPLVKELDLAAKRLRRTRAHLVRQAIEHYLDDFDDLRLGLERLGDPADPTLDWKDVRRELRGQD